jgi:hypothetical protein
MVDRKLSTLQDLYRGREKARAALERTAAMRNIPLMREQLQSWKYSTDDPAYAFWYNECMRLESEYDEDRSTLDSAVEDKNVAVMQVMLKNWKFSRDDPFVERTVAALQRMEARYEAEKESLAAISASNNFTNLRSAVNEWPFSKNDPTLLQYKEQMTYLKAETDRYKAFQMGDFRLASQKVCTFSKTKEAWMFPADPVFRVNALLFPANSLEKEVASLEKEWNEMIRNCEKADANGDMTQLAAILDAWMEKFPNFKHAPWVAEKYPEFGVWHVKAHGEPEEEPKSPKSPKK